MLLITCQAGDNRFAVDSRHVREVVPRVRFHRLAGSPPWLAGLMTYRGAVSPVIDLAALVDGGACPDRLNTRIVVFRAESMGVPRPLGLLAENVGLCEQSALTAAGGSTPLGSLHLDAEGVFQLIDVERLVSSERRHVLFPSAEAVA